ncbi:MAG: divalent metal cation transporter [Gemmatimonadales bacterium]
MKKLIQVALGIVTGIGGFLEIGSTTTSAQAGVAFGYQPIWALLLGMTCLIFMLEMSRRFAAVSKHTVIEGLRDRFGFGFFSIVLAGVALVVFLVLVAELGGVGLSLQLATGAGVPWWALPVAFLAWLCVWKGKLDFIEDAASVFGLVTIASPSRCTGSDRTGAQSRTAHCRHCRVPTGHITGFSGSASSARR